MEKETSQTPSQLNFRPITEGLGFHPFSDGLPYAPVGPQSRQSTSGTGAVAAGPSRFITSPSPSISISPGAIQSPARISVPVASPSVMPTQRQAAPQTTVNPPAPPMIESEYGYVYVMKRALAYLVDTALNTSLCIAALSAVLMRQEINPDLLMTPGVILVAAFFLVVFNWALITAQEVAFGTSIGKRIFGLALEGSVSALFLRAFFFLPSIGFCGVGLLWALFDRRKRCWHDLVVDLQPIELARL